MFVEHSTIVKKMKLRTKLPIFTSITILLSITVIAAFSIFSFNNEIKKSIKQYRYEETNKILEHLQDIVDISYSMIDNSFRASTPSAIEKRYNIHFADSSDIVIRMIAFNMLKITVENLRVLRFGVDGYIWINEYEFPYTVIMHPTKPDIEDKANVFYIGDTDKNVYEAFHDSIEAGEGAGRVSYNFFKPNSTKRLKKISWVRLYEPLGWVIGTGVYVTYIDEIVNKKTDELKAQIKRLIISVIFIGILLILIASLTLYLFGKSITSPIFEIQTQLSKMAKGKIVSKLNIQRKDEIGEMKNSLDALINGFTGYSQFAKEIGKGDYQSNFSLLSDDDILGNSLLEMRKSLIIARREERNRLDENTKRQWTNDGTSKFSDIIRNNSGNVKLLSEIIISELINYTKATLGGIFIANYKDIKNTKLDLMASVAYNRKKFIKKQIDAGDGLIGACFLEQSIINITKLPQDYLDITSGLGTANPENLLIIPLIYEQKVYGVLEIASLNIFLKHEIAFIETVCQNLAISISTSE